MGPLWWVVGDGGRATITHHQRRHLLSLLLPYQNKQVPEIIPDYIKNASKLAKKMI
jgi:hypothetical protein